MQTAVGKAMSWGAARRCAGWRGKPRRVDVVALNGVLIDQFIAGADGSPPTELILDIDASDIPLHGDQELEEFNAYYDTIATCRFTSFAAKPCSPVSCGTAVLMAPSMPAAVIKLLVTRLRQVWPKVR